MSGDFNRIIIQLIQSPVMNWSISDLTFRECEYTYALIKEVVDMSVEEDYTLLDYIQMARLEYCLGELSCRINGNGEDAALRLLEKGGFDLSLKKWVGLVSLRIEGLSEG